MRKTFTITVDIKQQSYVGDAYTSLSDHDIATLITAGLWKTYANPERDDAGILAVVKVEPTGTVVKVVKKAAA